MRGRGATKKLFCKVFWNLKIHFLVIRFLYTKKVLELLFHHFIKGFDYKQFRKTDYIDLEAQANNNQLRKIYLEYDNS